MVFGIVKGSVKGFYFEAPLKGRKDKLFMVLDKTFFLNYAMLKSATAITFMMSVLSHHQIFFVFFFHLFPISMQVGVKGWVRRSTQC